MHLLQIEYPISDFDTWKGPSTAFPETHHARWQSSPSFASSVVPLPSSWRGFRTRFAGE
jgi:hypothetical protein